MTYINTEYFSQSFAGLSDLPQQMADSIGSAAEALKTGFQETCTDLAGRVREGLENKATALKVGALALLLLGTATIGLVSSALLVTGLAGLYYMDDILDAFGSEKKTKEEPAASAPPPPPPAPAFNVPSQELKIETPKERPASRLDPDLVAAMQKRFAAMNGDAAREA